MGLWFYQLIQVELTTQSYEFKVRTRYIHFYLNVRTKTFRINKMIYDLRRQNNRELLAIGKPAYLTF